MTANLSFTGSQLALPSYVLWTLVGVAAGLAVIAVCLVLICMLTITVYRRLHRKHKYTITTPEEGTENNVSFCVHGVLKLIETLVLLCNALIPLTMHTICCIVAFTFLIQITN